MSTVAPAKAEPGSKNGNSDTMEKKGLSLWLVFVIGFVFSLVVIVLFVYAFAAYHTRDWSPWNTRPLMTGDDLFGIIRNAVTVAAALGVGITLFFSYRKQQTAESTHRISAEAQRTAAQALQLTAQQHGNDLTKGMRERFSKAAEHLGSANASLAIAGAHALEALAGEWYDAGNFRERQNCIDLLCAYPMISEQHTEPKGFPVASVKSAIATRVFAHLARNLQPKDYWAVRIDMKNPGFLTGISNLYVNGAYLDFRNLTPREETGYFEYLTLERGTIDLRAMDLDREALYFYDCKFTGGDVSLGLEAEYNASGAIRFRKCEFDGTNFWVPYNRTAEFAVSFEDCTFREGALFDEKTHPRSLSFVNCTFEKQVFPTDPGTWIDRVEVTVDSKTTFADGVPEIVSKKLV